MMTDDVKLTHTSALILQTIGAGYLYGFDVMEATGLPSGTVYPALRRLEQQGLIQSRWEKESKALAEQRPARKYYRLTAAGDRALAKAVQRYPLLQHMTRSEKASLEEAGRSKSAGRVEERGAARTSKESVASSKERGKA